MTLTFHRMTSDIASLLSNPTNSKQERGPLSIRAILGGHALHET